MPESLEDHLRQATRNFTSPLPEERVFALGRDLAQELARAHAESPPRHPEITPSDVIITDGKPRLEGGDLAGDASEDLFRLGALLVSLVSGAAPDVSWRLDGPPAPDVSTLARQAALLALASPRRHERFSTAAEAVAALQAALRPAEAVAAPWPLFRGDAARTGARAAGSAGGLAPAWHAPLGRIVASPVLTSDLVFAATADGRLLFLDRASGRRIHELPLASAVESSPAILDHMLYVGTDDGDLAAIDLVSGRAHFRARLGQVVRSSPLATANRILIGVMEAKLAGALVALDPASGKMLWKRKLGAVFSSPALAGARVLVGSDDGCLHALDLDNGTIAWSYRFKAKVRATPAVAGDLAVVGDFSGELSAIRLADGTAAWTAQLGHTLYSSPCVAAGLCVVGCHEGHVHALDLATGEPRFLAQTGGPAVSSPVAVGDTFLLGSTDGNLYLIDATGSVRQRVALGSAIESSLALDGTAVFVGSGAGLHALRLNA